MFGRAAVPHVLPASRISGLLPLLVAPPFMINRAQSFSLAAIRHFSLRLTEAALSAGIELQAFHPDPWT